MDETRLMGLYGQRRYNVGDMVFVKDQRNRALPEWRSATITAYNRQKDEYEVRINKAKVTNTFWVKADQLLPRETTIPDLDIDIEGRGIRFYDRDFEQDELEKLYSDGLVPVRFCDICEGMFRNFVFHFRENHEQLVSDYPLSWRPPSPRAYSAYRGPISNTAQKRPRRELSPIRRSNDEDNEDDDYDEAPKRPRYQDLLNTAFLADDDQVAGAVGGDLGDIGVDLDDVGGDLGAVDRRPRIYVRPPEDLGLDAWY